VNGPLLTRFYIQQKVAFPPQPKSAFVA